MSLSTDTFTGVTTGKIQTVSGGKFDVSIRFGAAVGTIQIQRSFDDFATFGVLRQVTNASPATDLELVLETASPCKVRAACTAFTSGSIVAQINA